MFKACGFVLVGEKNNNNNNSYICISIFKHCHLIAASE